MKNTVLCVVLGCCAAVSAAALDYVNGDILFRSRLEEKAVYAELNADMHRRYGGYTVDELCIGYEPATEFLGKKEIQMEIVNQYPEMPVGCEITCAAAMLNFLGYGIDKCELADNYMTVSNGNFTEKNGVLYGADPHRVFVGDPYGKGYGCYKEVIADVLNSFFEDKESENRAIILEDANSADLEKLIDGGVPVMVWASIDMKPYRYNAVSNWVTEDGKEISWLSNSHTLILIGYDSTHYYFMDCNNKTDICRYAKQTFVDRWTENGSQTIVVKLG